MMWLQKISLILNRQSVKLAVLANLFTLDPGQILRYLSVLLFLPKPTSLPLFRRISSIDRHKYSSDAGSISNKGGT